MKKLYFILLAVAGLLVLESCNDTETYSDQKKREREAIKKFISNNNIKIISEADFKQQNNKTNIDKNEYVLFEGSGVYMQIVREGCGEKIKNGETVDILCRFTERNLLTDSIQLTNEIDYFSSVVDKMTVTNTSGTFTASFNKASSMMYQVYGSASVPSGWLTPLTYINIGRPEKEGDEIAKVKIIVPHTQGQAYASSGVYPCFYEITYQRGL